MSMWKRLKRVVKSQANSALSQLENPEAELDLLEEELENEKKQGRLRLADSMVELKLQEKAVEKAREESNHWEKKAIRAIELDNDELAREALTRKASCDEILNEQEEDLQAQRTSLKELKQSQQQLEERIDQAQRKRKILQAKMKGTQVKESIGQALSTQNVDSPMAEFDRMVHKVEQIEAQVELNNELNHELAANDVERQLRELEERAPIEPSENDPLLALKEKMKKKQSE